MVYLLQLQEEERVPEVGGDAAPRHQRHHYLSQRGQVHSTQDHCQVGGRMRGCLGKDGDITCIQSWEVGVQI